MLAEDAEGPLRGGENTRLEHHYSPCGAVLASARNWPPIDKTVSCEYNDGIRSKGKFV